MTQSAIIGLMLRAVTFGLILSFVSAIQIKNRRIYDDEGRQIMFHGPNIVVKVPPYKPSFGGIFNPMNSFSENDLQNLKEWGWNGIRLGMMWAGVEPEKDTYNETYLKQMLQLVNLAGSKYGIYSLIDFHQDLIAEKFCGDGIPTWLVDEIDGYHTFPWPVTKTYKLNKTGLPDWQDCTKKNWGTYYFSDDVGRVFNHLYDPHHHLNKKFTDFWVKVVSVFKNNPYVIAYELINEPFIGDFVRAPLLVIPSVAERLKFQNFYDRLSHEIRKEDPKAVICFEPVTFDNFVPAGFSHTPGGEKFQNNSIFCYHYYKPPALGPSTLYARIRDGKRLNTPSFLDELYGAEENQDIFARADSQLQPWLFWGFKDFGKNWGGSQRMFDGELQTGIFFDNGTADPLKLAVLSRTFMQRTAGKMLSVEFSSQDKIYRAIYEATPNRTSILYLNKKINYVNGALISAYPSDSVRIKENGNYVELTYVGTSVRQVSVTVIPIKSSVVQVDIETVK